MMAVREECVQDYGGSTIGKRPLGKPRRGWEYKINMGLKGNMLGGESSGSCPVVGIDKPISSVESSV
jgi:hypothetical protein